MNERGEGRPRGELTTDIKSGSRAEIRSDRAVGQPDIFERLRRIPDREDPAFWPIRVMTELVWLTDPVADGPLAKQWAPFRDSLQRVKTAYEILAFPHVKEERWREEIETQLETDRQLFGRDQVDLDDAEVGILGKLAATAKIPCDPSRRNYSYSDVPLSPDTDPFGRRHMKTPDIRRMMSGDTASARE